MSRANRTPTNVAAVKHDLAALPEDLAQGALAAAALTLAAELDNPETSATAKSMCAGRLLDTMRELRELAPPAEKRDGIDGIADDLAARRARVAAGSPRAADQTSP